MEQLAQTAAENAQVEITERHSDREKQSSDDIVTEDIPSKA